MPISMKLWRVVQETELKELPTSSLEAEYILEDWIAKDSSLLGMELLMIGRQVTTDFGGRIDLLAIDRQGDVTIIELKTDRRTCQSTRPVFRFAPHRQVTGGVDMDKGGV